MADSGVQFTMSDAELVTDTDHLCPTTDAEQEVSVSDLPKASLTLPTSPVATKEEKKEDHEKGVSDQKTDKKEDKGSSSGEDEEEKKPPSVEEEDEKEKGVDEDVGAEEQELVEKVKGMSVASVDDGVDFGHDALEATSSAEAELAPDPLKKPASSLPSSSACPSVPDDPMDSSLPTSSPPSKEVLPSSPRKPKPPPYAIPDDLAQFIRERPLLKFDGGAGESDSGLCVPPSKEVLPRSSSLKRSKSRGRSKSRSGGDVGRSRSRTSPDRSSRAKPAGCLPSTSLGPDGSPSLPPLPPMPDDPSSPTLKSDLLKWISLSLRRDWKEGAKAWVNLHVGLYLYEPSYKYSICHPRCLAACTVSKDLALDEPFCCWTCNKRPSGALPGEVYRTLWPSHTAFVWHWCLEHANPSQKAWSNLANSVGITASDLAFELLGVDLAVWPLPWKPEAVASLPKRLPPKKGGHSPKIAESPWFMSNPSHELAIVPVRNFNKPKPPSYPPPPSVTSRGNKIGPIRPLPKHGDVSASLPSSSLPVRDDAQGATSKASAPAPIQLDLPEPLRAAAVLAGGSRFNHSRSDDKTAMGWVNPLKSNSWRALIEKEIASFIAPFQSIGNYTTSRTVWYDRFMRHSPLRSWLLAMEEHTFYVYLLACLVTKIMARREVLTSDDREVIFARFTTYSCDLREESLHYSSFILSGDLPACAGAIMDHVHSIVELRVPLPAKYSYLRAPEWVRPPRCRDEGYVYCHMSTS